MKKIIPVIICFSAAAVLTFCSSVDYRTAMKEPEKQFYDQKYLEAARMLLPMVNKGGKDQLLFMMECGYMLHAGGEYDTSNKVLLKAGKIAKIIPVSVTQQVDAMLRNETKTNYRGEDFEKVLVRMYSGLNFLMLKDYDSARVEFRGVNDELVKIKTENNQAKYKQNLMAKYLAALAFEITGDAANDAYDWEYAYVECKQIAELNPGFRDVRADLARLAAKLGYAADAAKWRAESGLPAAAADSGEVILLFQSGQNAIKKSRGKLMQDADMRIAILVALNTQSLAAGVTVAGVMLTLQNIEHPIPAYEKRSNKITSAGLTINGRRHNTFVIEDVETTTLLNHHENYSAMKTRLAVSIATKAAVSVAAGIAAKQLAENSKKYGGAASLIGMAASIGVGAALFSQLEPDLRCWHTLPAKLHIARVPVRPGTHKVDLNIEASGGVSAYKKSVNVTVGKNERVIINERVLF
jgi:hypothetical protein